jgi:hypothetical protein
VGDGDFGSANVSAVGERFSGARKPQALGEADEAAWQAVGKAAWQVAWIILSVV